MGIKNDPKQQELCLLAGLFGVQGRNVGEFVNVTVGVTVGPMDGPVGAKDGENEQSVLSLDK